MAKKNKHSVWDVDNVVWLWDEDFEESDWDEEAYGSFFEWPTEGELTALLDADMFPYIVGFCHSEEKFFKAVKATEDAGFTLDDPDSYYQYMSKTEYADGVMKQIHTLVNSWTANAGCDSCVCFLTEGKKQFRFKVAFLKQYKNRGSSKPPFFHFCRWYIQQTYKTIVSVDEEADDAMATWQYEHNQVLAEEGAEQGSLAAKRFSGTCIVTKDKDLRMIPGWHSNPNVNKGEPFWVDYVGWLEPKYDNDGKMTELKGAGMKFFFAQCIMGDTVDTYPGLPGAGAVRAYSLLNELSDVDEMQAAVIDLYAKKYGQVQFKQKAYTGENVSVNYMQMFVEQARLAWMQTKKGEMYMPNIKLPKIDWKKQFKEEA